MTATLTPATRRTFGISREVYLVACGCGWVTEVGHVRMAEAVRANHKCREDDQ